MSEEELNIEGKFYSEKEKLFFIITGYVDNSDAVVDQIVMLSKYGNYMFESTGNINIKTQRILKSNRYKHMRVFYVKVPAKPYIDDVFSIGEDWTMMQWIQGE